MWKYTKPINLRLGRGIDSSQISQARSFLGKMINVSNGDPIGKTWNLTLKDGTSISAYIPAEGMFPIVSISSREFPTEPSSIPDRDYLYLILQGGGVWREVYRFDGTGDQPKFITRVGVGDDYLAPTLGFGVYKGNFYTQPGSNIYKNNSILTETVTGANFLVGVSNKGIVSGSADNIFELTNLGGGYEKTILPPSGQLGSYTLGANDHGFAYQDVQSNGEGENDTIFHNISDYSGGRVSHNVTYINSSHNSSANQHTFLYIDDELAPVAVGYKLRVINKLGSLIGTKDMAPYVSVSSVISHTGVLGDKLFTVSPVNISTATGFTKVRIFDFKLTFEGSISGEATGVDMTNLLHTITLSQAETAYLDHQFFANDAYDWVRSN